MISCEDDFACLMILKMILITSADIKVQIKKFGSPVNPVAFLLKRLIKPMKMFCNTFMELLFHSIFH